MKKISILSICSALVIFMNCSSTKKMNEDEIINLRIEEINEFNSFYRFRGLSNDEPIFIISFKNEPPLSTSSSTNKTSKLELNSEYLFKVKKLKTRISTMQQLGQFVIIEADTLWRGESNLKAPKYYISQNTIGLYLK